MLLHFCQPTESGSKELGRMKPNGGMIYPREVFFFFLPSLFSFSHKGLRFLAQRPSLRKLFKLPESS